jgi:NitT/TauT family transport system ATP-binding protein
MILGIEKADEGEIEGIPEKISVVFQEDRLSAEFTPMGNILAVTGKSKSGNEILDVFSDLGLGEKDVLRKKVFKMSGGMKRRVAICRALCAEGNVLILDEPFSGLDEKTKDKVIETIKKYACGKTVILVTHDIEDIEKMNATKVIRL